MTATLREPETREEQSGPWEMLSAMLPAADWTAEALAGRLEAAVQQPGCSEQPGCFSDVFDRMCRVLYRRSRNHLLVTGLKGVGKTAAVRELARRAAEGEIGFLSDRRFLWLDCTNVGPEDSRGCLETIAMSLDGASKVVLCLDGLDALLKRGGGRGAGGIGSNKPLLRAIARRNPTPYPTPSRVQIIGMLSKWAFNDLVGGDAEMLELFTRVEIEEPEEETVLEIVRRHGEGFAREFGLKIDEKVVRRAVSLGSNYLLSENQPAKSIRILREACENIDYEATQLGRRIARVTPEDVAAVVAEGTGIPLSTLAGESAEGDFAGVLTQAVVGQEEAVRSVATELRLIKAGLSEPEKPASVMLFAGMTGVGKTELAKRVAELYSTSKRLQVYSMGNFTEPHSVSGIIGVPAGYVGHDQGGRLINELNADPYSVFLLDEAEKCHPNVWKPFLNLFDEGWITDQRGVKAYADRAIFILTTNAGDNAIAQMSRSGKPPGEIIEQVKQTLSRIRQERSSQPVFTPQFLSRMKRIIVFQPLEEAAMIEIARMIIGRVRDLWRRKREKELVVTDELIAQIGKKGHALNEQSGGKEGGRIVRKLVADWIEDRVQLEATARREEYRRCRRIVVEEGEAEGRVRVLFEG